MRLRGARHGGELVRGRGVGRALLPRPALHHEPRRRRTSARRAAAATGAAALAAQHAAEVAQGRAGRRLVAVRDVLKLLGQQCYITIY